MDIGNMKDSITSLNSHFTPLKFGTKCGGRFKIAKVWIKVCYMKSHWNGGRVYVTPLDFNTFTRSLEFEIPEQESKKGRASFALPH